MTQERSSASIFNISSDKPFAKHFCQAILADYKGREEALAHLLILLPTRRACRTIRETFLLLSAGKPMILPRMQPLGEVDEEELAIDLADHDMAERFFALKPALSSTKRRILLARAIFAIDTFEQDFAGALRLADALAGFMDQVIIEERDLADLDKIVPEEFADHWQITLEFLKILSETWPRILEENGVIDAVQRRSILMDMLTSYWHDNPPNHPVIAAGSTGSHPATARLLGVVASMDQGALVLPGLDQHLDDEAWAQIDPGHPQFGLKQLLERLHVDRRAVQDFGASYMKGGVSGDAGQSPRHILMTEMMRPAAASLSWQYLANDAEKQNHLKEALSDIWRYDCQDEQDEAQIIALHLRQALEQPEIRASVITPDRALAARIQSHVKRWGIAIDDSAGQPLSQTKSGVFARLALDLVLRKVAPVSLLAFLKHRLCRLSADKVALSHLEKYALRGLRPAPGFGDYFTRLEAAQNNRNGNVDGAKELLSQVENLLNDWAIDADQPVVQPMGTWLQAHIALMENAAFEGRLWQGEDGEALSLFFADLLDHAAFFPDMNLSTYHSVIEELMGQPTVRPSYGMHPRLSILGQLEARLFDADIVILAGLNEGVWPSDSGHDPFLSRPMRHDFGLPAVERHIGLAAHDFVQGFCASNVILTRAEKRDGAPTVPSRWLQRLDVVMQASALNPALLHDPRMNAWMADLADAGEVVPEMRPAPVPPLEARPTRLSVTRVDGLMKDPYGIYARAVLGLKKHDDLEQEITARERGNILHHTFEHFVKAYPDDLPEDADRILHDLARAEATKIDPEGDFWAYWWPRFGRIADWFLNKEKEWRKQASTLAQEVSGHRVFKLEDGSAFHLYAKADRIDERSAGLALIDYKSGTNHTKKGMSTGKEPQLPLEGLIAEAGGFDTIAARKILYLGYWVVSGSGDEPGKEMAVREGEKEHADLMQTTHDGFLNLMNGYRNPQTPYYAIPNAANAPQYNDYEHLARVKEWAALDDQEE